MIRRTLALTGLIAVAGCSNALAAPVPVDVRIEGAGATVFEGGVTTDGRPVDGGDGTGAHACDGSSSNPPQAPGPTMGSALDDAGQVGGFSWAGTWQDISFGGQSFGSDFFVTRIGPDTAGSGQFWGLYRNDRFADAGICQQKVQEGDDLLFALVTGSEGLLELSGAPQRAAVGEAFSVLVERHDGGGGTAPSAGANVAGATTGTDGRATLSFDSEGLKQLKASKVGEVRSNAAVVCVYVPGSGGCGTEPAPGVAPSGPQLPSAPGVVRDTSAPRAFISGIRNGRTYRRAPRVLRGRVEDDRGIHGVYLRVRMIDALGCRWLSGRSETFSRPRSCDGARFIRLGDAVDWSYQLPFELRGGARYIVDLKVLDRGLNRDTEQVRFRVAG